MVVHGWRQKNPSQNPLKTLPSFVSSACFSPRSISHIKCDFWASNASNKSLLRRISPVMSFEDRDSSKMQTAYWCIRRPLQNVLWMDRKGEKLEIVPREHIRPIHFTYVDFQWQTLDLLALRCRETQTANKTRTSTSLARYFEVIFECYPVGFISQLYNSVDTSWYNATAQWKVGKLHT